MEKKQSVTHRQSASKLPRSICIIGQVEGIADAVAAFLRPCAGRQSDASGENRQSLAPAMQHFPAAS
jgi:hypothetical protein